MAFKNRDEVKYRYKRVHPEQVVTRIEYPCGCVIEIHWEDIYRGETKEVIPDWFCEEHDPTTNGKGKEWKR